MRKEIILIISLFIFLSTLTFFEVFKIDYGFNLDKKAIQIKEVETQKIPKIFNSILKKDIELVFCPSSKCLNIYKNSFEKAEKTIKCAFYEFNRIDLAQTLSLKKNIEIEIIVDNNYLKKENLLKISNLSNVKIYSDKIRNTKYNNYMHEKFCVIDEKIIVFGSANPTINGFDFNNNNILKIENKEISNIFLNEFYQMKTGIFGYNKKKSNLNQKFNLSFENEKYNLDIFMCPQDNCDKNLIKYLNKSKEEILVMNFVLTLNGVENLLEKKQKNGILIKILLENRMKKTKSSIFKDKNKVFNFTFDKNKKTMHHKVFIVDKKFVILGSMNPSKSGTKYNDEFFLVIENPKIVKQFVLEFESLIK